MFDLKTLVVLSFPLTHLPLARLPSADHSRVMEE